MEPIAVTIHDAGRALGVSRCSIYRLISTGKLESAKIAGRRLVKVSSIRRLIGEEAA